VYQGEKNIYDNLSISDDSYNKNIHFDFRYGNIELAAFPFNQWNKVRNTFIANNQSDYMVEGISQGEYILRKELSRLLHESRGGVSNPEQIIIGSTPQQLVSLLCQLLEVDKYIIGVENPGYDGARNTFLNHGFQVHAIPLTVDGVSIEELEKSHANVMYVSPSQQFMNKMVMSQDKRQQLIRWVYSNKEVNKMVALEQSGLSLETFICFGNDMNDLPLFQKAHHSVVIGEYEPLLMIAKDQILVDEQVEKNIISKLQELSTTFG
jgi:GntR family transcriptional regulator/MocR family aminotransferase